MKEEVYKMKRLFAALLAVSYTHLKYLLAHDLGTSGNKATLFTTEGELIRSSTRAYPTRYYNGNWAEQDPEAVSYTHLDVYKRQVDVLLRALRLFLEVDDAVFGDARIGGQVDVPHYGQLPAQALLAAILRQEGDGVVDAVEGLSVVHGLAVDQHFAAFILISAEDGAADLRAPRADQAEHAEDLALAHLEGCLLYTSRCV